MVKDERLGWKVKMKGWDDSGMKGQDERLG